MNGPLRTACFALIVSFALVTLLLIPDVSRQPSIKAADASRVASRPTVRAASLPTAESGTSSRQSTALRPNDTEQQQGPFQTATATSKRNTQNDRAQINPATLTTRHEESPSPAVHGPRLEIAANTDPGDHFASTQGSRKPEAAQSHVDQSRKLAARESHQFAEANDSFPGVIFQTVRPKEPPSRAPQDSQVEARLINMERHLTQLAQAQLTEKASELEKATQLLQQLQQTDRIQALEQQLRTLQTEKEKAPSPGALPAPPEAGGTTSTADTTPAPNVPADEPAKQPILNVQPSGGVDERFSLQIQDAQLPQVLDMLGQMAGVNILADKDVTGSISVNLQNVTIDEALQGILRSRGYVFDREGDFIYVMTEARKKLNRKLLTKVYRPNYITAADLQALITPILTVGVGKVAVTNPAESGIPLSPEEAGGNRLSQTDALLVQDYEQVITEVDHIVAEMDIPPMQVVIEAMILSVQLDDSMQNGVNFSLINDSANNLLVSGNGSTLSSTTGLPSGSAQTIMPAMGNLFAANTAGLKYGFIKDNVSAFVNALESITDTNLVASPQLRVLNKQKAELIIGNRVSYRTLAFNGTQTVENVNFLDAGTKLIMRPFIAPDGLVRLEVHPERSNATIDANTGLPNQQTTEVTTNVMVRDGSTVVIGGLIEEQVQEDFNRIPLLGALPYAGKLFRNRSESVTRTELIVLLTPRIIVEPEDALEGEALRYENEERANHFRDNLSKVNRRNLARMEYERAVELYENGELNWAKDYVERALEHSKNDMNALRLRDLIDDAIRQRTYRWWQANQAEVTSSPEHSSQPEYVDVPAEPSQVPPLPAPDAKP